MAVTKDVKNIPQDIITYVLDNNKDTIAIDKLIEEDFSSLLEDSDITKGIKIQSNVQIS
jgi:hypothetical protein